MNDEPPGGDPEMRRASPALHGHAVIVAVTCSHRMIDPMQGESGRDHI